jgi:hypothetical protein
MATETLPPGTTTATHTYAAGGDYTITATQSDGYTADTAVTIVEPMQLYSGMYMEGAEGPFTLTPTDTGTIQLVGDSYVIVSANPLPSSFAAPAGLQLAALTVGEAQQAGAGSVRMSGQLYPMAVLNQYPPGTAIGLGQVGGPSPMHHGVYSDNLGQDPIEEVVVDFIPALIVADASSYNPGQVNASIEGALPGEDLVITCTTDPAHPVSIQIQDGQGGTPFDGEPSPLTIPGDSIPPNIYIYATVPDPGITPVTMTVSAVQGTRSHTSPSVDVVLPPYDVEWLTNGTLAVPVWTFHLYEAVPEDVRFSTADPAGGQGWYVFNTVSTTPVNYNGATFPAAEANDPSITWTWRFGDGTAAIGTDDPFGNGQGWQLSVISAADQFRSAAFRLPFD